MTNSTKREKEENPENWCITSSFILFFRASGIFSQHLSAGMSIFGDSPECFSALHLTSVGHVCVETQREKLSAFGNQSIAFELSFAGNALMPTFFLFLRNPIPAMSFDHSVDVSVGPSVTPRFFWNNIIMKFFWSLFIIEESKRNR